jgi:pimeloyl-ACP methyl ester carboxylesterase
LNRQSAINIDHAAQGSVAPRSKGKLNIQRFVIPYRVYGSGETSLVFLNGIQQSMAMWHSFVCRFSHRFRIVLFDFPNQGTGRIVEGPADLSLDEQVDILNAVIETTGVDSRLTVCSASWGGVVALAYAERHPEKLQSLILASIGTKANQKMVEMITKGLEMPVKDRFELAKSIIENFGRNLPPAMKSRIVNQFQRMDMQAFQAFLRHGLNVLSVRELDKVVDVSKVQCKTTLVYGENDAIVDLEDVRFLASQMADSEVKVIKDVGHFLHLEKEELLDVYEEILAGLDIIQVH